MHARSTLEQYSLKQSLHHTQSQPRAKCQPLGLFLISTWKMGNWGAGLCSKFYGRN